MDKRNPTCRVPGLITQWRAPYKKALEGNSRRNGNMTLAIANPTNTTLILPKTVKIDNYRPAKFIKKVGQEDSEAMLDQTQQRKLQH